MSLPAAARPDDRDALRAAVREVHAHSGMGVVFGGPVQAGSCRIDELVGGRTRYLRGLEVRSGAGLGGRVISEGRPAGVEDYGRALDITHEYDGPVLAEGLRTVAAVPVLVGGRARAVLYAASREGGSVGDRVRAPTISSMRTLSVPTGPANATLIPEPARTSRTAARSASRSSGRAAAGRDTQDLLARRRRQ